MSDQSIPLKGLVVEFNLPSRALFHDWVRRETTSEVRVSEIVELLPENIFRELDTIRRQFYKRVEPLIISAYTLKLLPVKDLPKLRAAVVHTRKRLKTLDRAIIKATKTDYFKKATQYYREQSNKDPKTAFLTEGRFRVSMIPLRLNALAWDTFLTDELKQKRAALSARYRKEKKRLANQLDDTQTKLTTLQQEVATTREELIKNYGDLNLPVDLATMKIEKTELTQIVKNLEYRKMEIERKIKRLDQNRRYESRQWRTTTNWAIRQTEKTHDAIRFDVQKLWRSHYQQLIQDAKDTYEMDARYHKQRFTRIREKIDQLCDRIWSVQQSHALISQLRALEGLVVMAANGSNIQKQLEVIK
jgi:hypothetical protein